jgi:predicted permease
MWPRLKPLLPVFVLIGLGVWPECSGLAVQTLRRVQLRLAALERFRRADV